MREIERYFDWQMCQEQRYKNGNLCEAVPEIREKQGTPSFSNTTMSRITGGESDPVCQGMCEKLPSRKHLFCVHTFAIEYQSVGTNSGYIYTQVPVSVQI